MLTTVFSMTNDLMVRTADEDGYVYWTWFSADGGHHHVKEHHAVALVDHSIEEVCGDGQVIHHENEVPWHNTPENVTPMSREEHIRQHHGDGEYDVTEQRLRDLYHSNELTLQECADVLDVSDKTVQRRMREYGIERRDPADVPRDIDMEMVMRRYREGVPVMTIAEDTEVTHQTLHNRIEKRVTEQQESSAD